MSRPRILITDILYPNKYSTWRNEMINYLLRNTNADILVFRVKETNVKYDFDYSFCNSSGLLENHKHLSNFSDNKVIRYGLFKGEFDLAQYNFVYHMFAKTYIQFNSTFTFPSYKQFVHLYPGAGYAFNRIGFPKDVGIISTHPETTEIYSDHEKKIECFFGPHMNESDEVKAKDFSQKQNINICFASLGNGALKGDLEYLSIVEEYLKSYPQDDIKFFSIGNCTAHRSVTKLEPMDYLSLQKFYGDNIDVYISTETGTSANGWPLGVEAVKMGTVLLTTDHRNTASRLNLPHPSVVVCSNTGEFIKEIKQLYDDRKYMNKCSENAKTFFSKHITVENQQDKILRFMCES